MRRFNFKRLDSLQGTPLTAFIHPINKMAESNTGNVAAAFEYGFRDVFAIGACSCISPSAQGQCSFADDESAIVGGSVKTAETAVSSRHAEESSRSNEPDSREHAEESSPSSKEPVSPADLRVVNNNARACNDADEFEVTVDTYSLDQPHKFEPSSKRRVGPKVNKVWRSVRENSRLFKRGSSMNLIKRSDAAPSTKRVQIFNNRIPRSDSSGSQGSF